MFLDPEPKRRKTSRDMSSGFFSSQRPIASPKDPSRTIWRQALREKSESENNQRSQTHTPNRPTVRLVSPSPSLSDQPQSTSINRRSDAKENWQDSEHTENSVAKPVRVQEVSVSEPRISDASRTWSVSDSISIANDVPVIYRPPSINLLSSNSLYALPSPTWHRRSTSSGMYSQSSTLQGSEIAPSKKSLNSGRHSNISQISTLRSTSAPYEQEHLEREEAETRAERQPLQTLQILSGPTPERLKNTPTIRPVSRSEPSSPTDSSPDLESTEIVAGQPHDQASDYESEISSPRASLEITYPLQPIPPLRLSANTPNNRASSKLSKTDYSESREILEPTLAHPSSPNFIAYSPDSSRPASANTQLRSVTSIESINALLSYAATVRPATSHTLASNDSSTSLQSNDFVAPLRIPRRRLRHKAKSESLGALAGSSRTSAEMDEDVDTFTYRRRAFSGHLSTIASESEHSRNASLQLSHFSVGSGILTGDDASSRPLSSIHKRQSSAPAASMSSSIPSSRMQKSASDDFATEVGDMTLGIFRDESAVPEPLFRASEGHVPDPRTNREGPLLPFPTEVHSQDGDEDIDTLSALQAPPLRGQRSWLSLRQQSTNASVRSRPRSQISYTESERHSQGAQVFPIWARRFYSGTAVLNSKVSLNSMTSERPRPIQSSGTDRSITSRPETGITEARSSSPVSSHFLPRIFRPRTRLRRRRQSANETRSSRIGKSRRSRHSQDTRDSMAIERAPRSSVYAENAGHDFLPSGQPRWGMLKDTPSASLDTQRRLPRKYSKQRLWDQMEFPRPMTKDRVSDLDAEHPHLAPSKRPSQQRLSAWHAPSFVSSLDTLITSKHNRQILCFTLGFLCPLIWMVGAVLPLPKRPISADDLEKRVAGCEQDIEAAMIKHSAGSAETRWREEQQFRKGKWWRMLNRIMSVIGVLVITAVIALAVVATS